jgi:hypothetical protein
VLVDQVFVIDSSSHSVSTQLTFDAVAPQAAFIVLNGDLDGSNPMRGGKVELNGNAVLGATYFKITGAIVLMVPVEDGENVLDVVLRGVEGSTLSVQMLQAGSQPPPPPGFPPGTIFVSKNNGFDAAGCGSFQTSPCSTISFGLQRASESAGPEVVTTSHSGSLKTSSPAVPPVMESLALPAPSALPALMVRLARWQPIHRRQLRAGQAGAAPASPAVPEAMDRKVGTVRTGRTVEVLSAVPVASEASIVVAPSAACSHWLRLGETD